MRNFSQILLVLLALSLASCHLFEQKPPPPRPPRLVLLYAPCTVNEEYLEPYNPAVEYTPHMAEFAKRSVVFRRHQTEAGASGIAYAALFSGTQVDRHGVFRHPSVLPTDLYMVSEAYADAGYETFYWNGHGVAAAEYNYAQGVPEANLFKALHATDRRFLEVLDRLRSDPTYKAFVMTNFSLTHGPYRPAPLGQFLTDYPGEQDGITDEQIAKYVPIYRQNVLGLSWAFPDTVAQLGLSRSEIAEMAPVIDRVYRSNVRDLDTAFGNVVDAIGARDLLDESLIVFTADHGEALYGEDLRFKWSHSGDINPEVLTVPLLISSHDPRVRPGAYEGVTRSIDVVPTMLGLSGIGVPEGAYAGRDLSKVLIGREKAPDLLAYSHTQTLPPSVFHQMYDEKTKAKWTMMRKFHPSPDPELIWVAVRKGDEQYQFRNLDGTNWGFEVIDLADGDKRERPFDPADPAYAEMAQRLRDYKELLVRSHARRKEGVAIPSEKEADILRRLGYIE